MTSESLTLIHSVFLAKSYLNLLSMSLCSWPIMGPSYRRIAFGHFFAINEGIFDALLVIPHFLAPPKSGAISDYWS